MDTSAQIKELLDWHLTECLHICVADCGCPEEEQAAWADRTRIIGDQAFIEHLHEKIMEIVSVLQGRIPGPTFSIGHYVGYNPDGSWWFDTDNQETAVANISSAPGATLRSFELNSAGNIITSTDITP